MEGVNVSVPVNEEIAAWLAQIERDGSMGDYVRQRIVADMRYGGKYCGPTELEKARAESRALRAEREAERQAYRKASW